ncbi:hypothetical protein FV289_23085 [Escherichia coli]|uniref:hypothetical protein n=1 Tax=Escherichia coli TaxID=562 RepID=UPI0011C9494A|nr:hypothetical protein [Escherichia coli]TXQ54516.1 hypothetical protein FV289_23085 [Escherichia coli]
MADHDQETAVPVKSTHQSDIDKAAVATKPDEARMSEIAKRLLSTPPDRQSVGKALAPKKPS